MLSKTQGLIAFCQVFTALSVVYLVVGLIKPKWVWLGDKAPHRQVIIAIGLVVFMASMTAGTELSVRLKKEQAEEQKQAAVAAAAQAAQAQPPAPTEAVPAPQVPAAATAVPAAAATTAAAASATKAPAKQPAAKKKTEKTQKAPAKSDDKR